MPIDSKLVGLMISTYKHGNGVSGDQRLPPEMAVLPKCGKSPSHNMTLILPFNGKE